MSDSIQEKADALFIQPPRPWWSRLPWRSSLLVVLVLTAMVVVPRSLRTQWAQRADAALESYRAAGLPTTPQELDAWYPQVPQSQNAALAYLQALEVLRRLDAEALAALPHLPSPGETIDDETLDALAETVAAADDVLMGLHRAAAFTESRYPIDLSTPRGDAGSPAHLTGERHLLTMAKLLVAEAIVMAEAGDDESATRAVIAALAVARSLDREPTLDAFAMRHACLREAIDAFEHAIGRVELSAAQLERIDEAMSTALSGDDMVRAIAGHVPSQLAHFEDEEASDHAFGPLGWAFYDASGVHARQKLGYLQQVQAWLLAVQAAPPARFDRERQVARTFDGGAATSVAIGDVAPLNALSTARVRTARTAIMIERYRAARGRLPDTLKRLWPKFLEHLPIDPCTGKPLIYRTRETGYVLYSVGLDGVDHFGAAVDPTGERFAHGSDVPFVVPH